MPDAMQLLSLAANVTQNAYGRIDQAMTQSLSIKQRAGEFEASMAAKAVEFAESQRINDARIGEMKAANSLRAQEFGIKKALLPLQFHSANLNLQRQKHLFEKQKEAENIGAFNEITEMEDVASAFNLIRTQNADHAKELIQLKSKHRAIVADGNGFDRNAYVSEQTKINDKYKDVTADPKSEFSDQTHFLLGEISPKVQSIYEKRKLTRLPQTRASAVAYLNMPPDQAAKNAELFGLALGDEIQILAPMQVAFQGSKKLFEDYSKLADELDVAVSQIVAKDEPEKHAETTERQVAYAKQRDAAFKNMMELQERAASGNYFPEDIEPSGPPKPEDDKRPDLGKHKADDGKRIAGIAGGDQDSAGRKMRDRILEVKGILDTMKVGGLISEVDLRYFQNESFDDGRPDDRTNLGIKHKVQDKIAGLDNVGDVFNENMVNDLLGSIKIEDGIRISDTLAEDLRASNSSALMGGRDQAISHSPGGVTKPYIHFGGSKSKLVNSAITSYDDIQEIVSKLPRSKQRAASEEIYAALLAASLSHVVTTK